jgi:hypothetical protein
MIVVRWLLVLVIAGCYQPAPQAGTPCSALGDCPTPLHCERGVCVAEPSDAMPIDTLDTGTSTDGPPIDTGPPTCNPPNLGAWSAPSAIGELAGPGLDGTPMMRADGLEMYWKSARNGASLEIYRAVRASRADDWGPPINVSELNSVSNEGSPELSPDALTIYISSDRSGTAGFNDLYTATRSTVTSAWSAPTRLAQLSSTSEDEGMMVMPSNVVAYLHSDRTGFERVYRVTRASPAAAWGSPVELTELNDGNYSNPIVTADDCRMYVQGFRADTAGTGDLYLSTRTQPSGPWGTPVKIAPPSTPSFDADPWISADERYLMFTTGNGLNNLELVEATR